MAMLPQSELFCFALRSIRFDLCVELLHYNVHYRLGVDEHTLVAWDTPSQGYWHEGHFQGDNIWASGGKDAPFDRPVRG